MTRAEILERMECEQYERPPAPIVHADPDTRAALVQLVELIREALGDR